MIKWIEVILDRIFAVIGAVVLSQAPLFIQSYTQQLTGHEKELHLQVDLMRQAATQSGKSLSEYIHKFLSSSDNDFVQQGHIMQDMFMRWENFSQALTALQESSALLKPMVFAAHLDTHLFQSTVAEYSFGLPLNAEGAAYALLGVALGFFVFFTCRKLIGGLFYLFKRLVWGKPPKKVAEQ